MKRYTFLFNFSIVYNASIKVQLIFYVNLEKILFTVGGTRLSIFEYITIAGAVTFVTLYSGGCIEL